MVSLCATLCGVPLSLRIKLLLGRFFGWDKDGIRLVLFVVALFAAAFLYEGVVKPAIWHDPSGLTDTQRQEIRDQFKDRLTPSPTTRH